MTPAFHEPQRHLDLPDDVTDTSSAPPVPRLPHLSGSGGWGWILVRHIAREVSAVPTPAGGKRVHVCMPVDG